MELFKEENKKVKIYNFTFEKNNYLYLWIDYIDNQYWIFNEDNFKAIDVLTWRLTQKKLLFNFNNKIIPENIMPVINEAILFAKKELWIN